MVNKELYRFCGSTRRFILFSVVLNAVKLGLSIGFAYLFAQLILMVINGTAVRFSVLWLIVGIVVLRIVLTKIVAMLNMKIIYEVKHKLRSNIYNKVLELGVSYQEVLTTQEITHLGVEGVEQLESYFGGYLTQFYYCFVASAILFLAIAPLSLQAGIILMIAAMFIPLSLQAIMGIVKKTQRRYWRKYADVGNLFLDSLTGLTTLKIFQADKMVADKMHEQAEAFRKQTMRVLGMQLNSIMIIDWIAYGSTGIVIALSVMKFIHSELSLFGVLAIVLLSAEFFVPVRTLTSLFHVAMTGVAAGDEILKFLNIEKPSINEGISFTENGEIAIQNFSYSYPDNTQALNNINMTIPHNSLVAIVGHSGCGKSTLASCINRSLEKKVVRINHNPHIFSATVRENILMGKENIDDAQIVEVLKKLKLWEFLEAKQGLDTKLMPGAKNISGGQAQRLAIARALLNDFDVYIFDEATSNVDVDSEDIILNIIKELAKTKIVIYISHKMSAVSLSDYIYVMESGKIIESGNHTDLMKMQNVYYKLYTEQEQLLDFHKMKENK